MVEPRLAAAARRDIQDIRTYSKKAFGAAIALDYVEGLRRAIKLLGERLQLGAREVGLGDDIRSFSYRSHRLYYRDEGDVILVIRILHHAQDAASIVTRTQ